MKILIATGNPHKLDEIQAIFHDCAQEAIDRADPDATTGMDLPAIELVSLSDIGLSIEEPPEDADNFEDNAMFKACYYADHAQMACIADDSGLEVDALGGAPGVISARYSGAVGPREEVDPENNRKLLDELSDTPIDERTARFVCVMAMCCPVSPNDPLPTRTSIVVRGEVHGRILTRDEAADPSNPEAGRGSNGFGYDPLFYLPDRGKTSAELPPAEKNRISHRGDASRKMWQRLAEFHAG